MYTNYYIFGYFNYIQLHPIIGDWSIFEFFKKKKN